MTNTTTTKGVATLKQPQKNLNKYQVVYLRNDDFGKPKTIHRKYIEGKNKSSVMKELYSIEQTDDLDILNMVLCRNEVELHIGDKLTEESISQMEQVFKEFKKEGGWKEYNDMNFSINGEEYWIYRCIKKPNRDFGFVSNKEQYEWWKDTGSHWNTFDTPIGFLFMNSGISNTKTSYDDKVKMITHTARSFVKEFLGKEM
jgi:hypothetical protein